MDLLKLAQRVRTIRLAQNLTVDELARKCQFSKGFISQVENFRTTPSLKALNKISSALGISVSDLIDGSAERPPYTFGNLSNGVEVQRNDNEKYGIHYYALAYSQIGRHLEAFVIEYTPSNQTRDFLMHDNEEFFVLLEGELEFYISSDDNVKTMKAGDTVYLTANLPHKVQLSNNCQKAKALTFYASQELRKTADL